MIKMINALTKSVMYVDESRKEEYLKRGHLLAETKQKSPSTSKKKSVAK